AVRRPERRRRRDSVPPRREPLKRDGETSAVAGAATNVEDAGGRAIEPNLDGLELPLASLGDGVMSAFAFGPRRRVPERDEAHVADGVAARVAGIDRRKVTLVLPTYQPARRDLLDLRPGGRRARSAEATLHRPAVDAPLHRGPMRQALELVRE